MKEKDFLAGFVGSAARAKIIRLLLFNRETVFTADEVAKRTQVQKQTARKELAAFEKLGILKKRSTYVSRTDTGTKKRGARKKAAAKKRTSGWVTNEQFEFLQPLIIFLRDISPAQYDDISRRLQGIGRVKLIVAAGALIDDSVSKVDLLIVGDHLDERKLQASLRSIEAEFGREISYAGFTTDEFHYRTNVYDKLIRDVLDYPHRVLLDRLGVTR